MIKKAFSLLTLIAFLSLLSISTTAQEFSPEQKLIINEKVQKLAVDYELFSQLSEDGIRISGFYSKKLRNLFETDIETNSSIIYNDVNLVNTNEEKLDIDEYIQFVGKSFPNGLAIKLTDIQIAEPEKDDKSDNYFIIFQAEKKIMGLYQSKFVYSNSVKLYFKIEFIEISENVYDNFTIKAISKQPFKIKKRKIKEQEFDVFVSGGKSSITASSPSYNDSLSFSPETGFVGGVNYNIFVNNKFGIGIGLGLSKYKSSAYLAHYAESYETIDSEGETYIRNVDAVNLIENWDILYADLPINLYYRVKLSNKFLVQMGVSTCFSLKLKDNYNMTGIYTYTGYYPRLNVSLSDLPENNFGTNQQTNYNGQLNLSPLNVSISGELTFKYLLDNYKSIYMGFRYSRNLMNIQGNSAESYKLSLPDGSFNSILNSGSSIGIRYAGIQLGIIFKLKKK